MSILKSIKSIFKGSEKPGVEFYPHDNGVDKDFERFALDKYVEADKLVQQKIAEWRSNREAYLGESFDRYGGWATRLDKDGNESYYTSDVLADKINDLISMHTSSGFKIYPMPDIDEKSNPYQNLANDLQDPIKAKQYFRKVWERVFDDIQDRRHMTKKDIMVLLDAYTCGRGVTEQTQRYDYKTGQNDIFIDVVIPEHFLEDPQATCWEDSALCFRKVYMYPYAAMQLLPKHKDEVASAVIGHENMGKTYQATFINAESKSLHEKKKGMVLVVFGYFRDDTVVTETIVDEKIDTETEQIMTVEKEVKKRKYKNGRKIIMLPNIDKVLVDEESEYKCFPFSVFEPFPVSWQMHGKNQSNSLQAVQMADDDVVQQALSNIKAVGNNAIIYDPTSLKEPDKIDNRIGIKIPVDNPQDVLFQKAQAIVVDSLQMHGALQTDSNRISGVESVAEGRPAGSLTSGKALNILLQGTQRKITPRNKLFADFKQDQGWQIADIVLYLYRAGRTMRVTDEDGLPMRLVYSLYDFTNNVDVRVDTDSAFPSDPVQRFAMMLEMAQTIMPDGGPLADRDAVYAELKMPGAREMIDRINKEIEQRKIMEQQMLLQQSQQEQANAGATRPPGPGQGSPPNRLAAVGGELGQSGGFQV